MFLLARLLMLLIMLGLAVALAAVVLPAFRRYLGGDDRRMIRGPRALPAPSEQMERLEERLDQLAAEQQHLADQQQFITKLLQERADRPKDDSA